MKPCEEVHIHDVAYGGRGVGRLADGRIVFVAGTIADEVVRVECARSRGNYCDGRLIEIVNASRDRTARGCPLTECPGCCYQHVDYRREVDLKQKQFADLLRRIGRIPDPHLDPPVASPSAQGYRNKITLHASMSEGSARMGYFADDNRTVVDVPRCPLAVDPINEHLAEVRAGRCLAKWRVGDGIVFRWTAREGVAVWVDRRRSAGGKSGGVSTVPETEAWLTEQTAIGELTVPRDAFFQVNSALADLLLREFMGVVRCEGPKCVVDLYGGVGVFGLAARQAGTGRVVGCDVSGVSIRGARRNIAAFGLDGVEYTPEDAATTLNRVAGDLVSDTTMVVVDPPRLGLERGVIDSICGWGPHWVVYISCAADTLARDLALLMAGGYSLNRTRMFDMFPRTPYFESMTILERRSRSLCA